ncbi:MAG: hypothetical protein JO106_02075 [Mycobacterium sp.]|nr:hypothetical protein [Mycobacterium sp.]
MTETPGPSIGSTSAEPRAVGPPRPRPDRLYQVAAWVAIVAGVVFIVTTILFLVCAIWCCG